MSGFTSLSRVSVGLALVLVFGVPMSSVVASVVGGFFGFMLLGIGAVFLAAVLFSNKGQSLSRCGQSHIWGHVVRISSNPKEGPI